jgi:4-amino-4-deoxy-L-arabinose transferase-like glycosyltransferase
MIKTSTALTVIILCVITYIIGFGIPLMEIDAAQYASISREMLENKSYLQVFDLGKDYLDKPPMLFWLSAFSMKIFGVHDWAYRLPSFLFSILAIYSTFKFTALFYKKEIALLSAVVLATSQALFLINHDVRTDTMLMGWVIFSIWQMAAWLQNKSWINFLLAFIGIAGGMMTKGPIALMVMGFAFVPHFILKREWKNFFKWEYILGVIIIAILLIPMSIGLYEQYDKHPGKIIHGVAIQSGLRFFYWTQSFGRITGESEWHENDSFIFLLQNMMWSFLPWIIFFLCGLISNVVNIIRQKFKLKLNEEFITTSGFVITYCALASSKAQLPHYVFIVFPLAAIITANFLYQLLYTNVYIKLRNILYGFHVFVFVLLWLVLIFLMAYPFQSIPKYVAGIAGLCFIILIALLISKKTKFSKTLLVCLFSIIGINIFLNAEFYPNLLRFQLGNTAADFINENHLSKKNIYTYQLSDQRAMDFYAQHIFPRKDSVQQFSANDIIIMPKDSLPTVQSKFTNAKVLHTGNDFHVTALSLPFLNPKTRPKEVPKYVIVSLSGK